jgi:hypothetical protein
MKPFCPLGRHAHESIQAGLGINQVRWLERGGGAGSRQGGRGQASEGCASGEICHGDAS